jgi:hypothetical protein
MGCFSWITQNSNRSIIMYGYGTRKYPTRTCYMWDNKGRRWRETHYEGYGEFGEKDYYVLLAEMNNEYGPEVTDEKKRSDDINLTFTIKNSNTLYPNLTDCNDWVWKNKEPSGCPEQECGCGYESEESYDNYKKEDRTKFIKTDKFDGWENGTSKPIKQNVVVH